MKKIFLGYYDILILFMLMIANEILLRYFCDIAFFTSQAMLYDMCFLLFISAILILFKGKIRKKIEIGLIAVSSIYCFAQSFHYAYFKTLFSFRKLSLSGELFSVAGEIFEKWNPAFILFIMPILLMITIKPKEYQLPKKYKMIFTVAMIAISNAGYIGINESLRQDYLIDKSWRKDYYLLKCMQNRNRYLERFGVMQFINKDVSFSLSGSKKLNKEELQEVRKFVDEFKVTNDNEMTGFFEGKNLIMILCESFDESAILEDLTPTLYNMAQNGYYFDNYYAPIFNAATGDSEFISQTSMLPSIEHGTTSYAFHLNSYPNALANLFKEKGYNVNSYHSYMSNFYNREIIHDSFGFDTFYDMEKLGIERYDDYKETINWIKDEELFKKMVENTDFAKPFYNFVITVSGHMPYRISRDELKENLEIINSNLKYQNLDDETKSYYAAQMLLDQGIEVLVEELKDRGELDNTVIIMFGDHYPYGLKSDEAKSNILKEDGVDIYKVPFLIYNKELGINESDTLCSTFDLYPTITNMFNLDSSDYYKVGKDVFDKNAERMVLFENGSILSDFFYFDSDKNTVFGLNGIDDNTATLFHDRIVEKVNKIFKYSQDILISDYYKKED